MSAADGVEFTVNGDVGSTRKQWPRCEMNEWRTATSTDETIVSLGIG